MQDHPFPHFEPLRRSAVWRAELLYFLAKQGKDALCRSSACFGYQAPELKPAKPEERENDDTTPLVTTTDTSPKSDLGKPRVAPSKQRYLRLLRREKIPADQRRTEAPARLAATPSLLPYTKPVAPAPASPPLAPWRRLWPFLRMALGTRNHSRAIDLPRLVAGLALGWTFRRFPRLPRNGWAPAAQLVVDQGLRLYPFWQDFQDLVEGLWQMRGHAGLEVVGFPEEPAQETIPWARRRHGLKAPYRLPEPGTPILILSDLGYLDAKPEPWLAFGRRLKAAGFRPIAFLPCPPRYWDDELGELFCPVVWDINRRLPQRLDSGRTRPEAAAPDPGVEQLLRLVAWAVRVEPGLLRALRARLGADTADVGTEAAVWRHPDVRNDGLTFVLRPERQEFYRNTAAEELGQEGAETQALYAEAHELLRTHHCGLHPAILAEEEMIRAQSLGIAPAPDALEFMWQVAATLDRDYPYLRRLHAWVLRMAERQHQALWCWEEGEPMAIVLAKVLMEQFKDADDIEFPPGFDVNRVRWVLDKTALERFELRQEVTGRGERKLVLKSPGSAHTEGHFGRGDTLIAQLSMATTRLQWQHQDSAGNTGPTHVVDIRHDRDIPVPPTGRLQVWGNHERLEIDAMERPAWARVEQGRGTQGEDLFILTPLERPDYPLWWLPPNDYPILDRSGNVVDHFVIAEGRFVGLETYRELREHGFRQPDWAQRMGQDKYGLYADFVYKGITQRFRWIMPGRFWMGSPEGEPERNSEREPRHEVILTRGYWLADTACTQALWTAVMGKNPSHFKGKGGEWPVEKVSWNDVRNFLDRLNSLAPGLAARLPTEAEWEYACRAGTETPFLFGANITPEQVNYDGNYPYAGGGKGLYRKETVDVKALPGNGWGLYQMHGNVWEWCADWLGDYPPGPVTDPIGPSEGDLRVLRGGSWRSGARTCRSANRSGFVPDYRYHNVGFRLARGRTASPAGG